MKKLFFALVIALTAATTVQAQSKIGHVNSQKLLDTLPSRKKAIEEIGAFEKRGITELQEMDQVIQKMYADYMKVRPTQSASINAYDEERIQKKQAELEARQGELEQKMQLMSQELNVKILAIVKEAVDIVAKRRGLNYVIDETNTLYASGTDITSEVIMELLKIEAKKPATATVPPKPAGGK